MKPLPGRSTAPPPLGLRQEIFALGGRHRGDALAGARIELEEGGLTPERRALLRSVVSYLSGASAASGAGDSALGLGRRATRADLVYLCAIIAAVSWIGLVLGGHIG